MQITLRSSDFNFAFEIVGDDGGSVLIQSDLEYPGVARTFGWEGEDDDLSSAHTFLTEVADNDEWVDDPGYITKDTIYLDDEEDWDDEPIFSDDDEEDE